MDEGVGKSYLLELYAKEGELSTRMATEMSLKHSIFLDMQTSPFTMLPR